VNSSRLREPGEDWDWYRAALGSKSLKTRRSG
jgi:hypothetical protein